MKKLLTLTLLGTLAGCGGMISDPNTTVATLSLSVDKVSGALVVDSCVASLGAGECAQYPNDSECDTMKVDILADGRTVLSCKVAGQLIEQGIAMVSGGAPFVCKASKDLSCQVCSDIYGAPVLDTCNRGAQLFRRTGGGWNATPGDDIPGSSLGGEHEGIPGLVPDDVPGSECDPENAIKNYANAINAILAKEGLGFAWDPSYLAKVDLSKGFWGYNGAGGTQNLCNHNWKKKLTTCWNGGKDKCHCIGPNGGKQTCRCTRVNVAAIQAACAQIPVQCSNIDKHNANLVIAYGAATEWLFSGGKVGGETTLPPGVIPPKCKGSPLVLDLDNNGIDLTSEKDGVKFDLLGLGSQNTAWIKGDDALLVYDRNGNGTIDDGSELFGESTPVDGFPAADGFDALAALDKPENGGNGNGIVEKGDLLFSELRVWRDANKDGKSQPAELATLDAVGVVGINTQMTSEGQAPDQHGNDLGMRGSFIFKSGKRGLMVDVLFSTSR